MEQQQAAAQTFERTFGDIFSGKPIDVQFGDKHYDFPPIKGRGKTRRFKELLWPHIQRAEGLSSLLHKLISEGSHKPTQDELERFFDLVTLFMSPEYEELCDLVYDWSPAAQADKEYIEDNAAPEEFFAALMAMVGLLYGPLFRKALALVPKEHAQGSPSVPEVKPLQPSTEAQKAGLGATTPE
ncbi:MAG: hypothetical protein V3U60_16240 [Gammaproteobacteria bacterium]